MMRMIVPNNDRAARDAAALLGPLSGRRPRLRRDRTGHAQGQDAPNQVQDEHRERMALVKQLADYYEALLIHLADQPDR